MNQYIQNFVTDRVTLARKLMPLIARSVKEIAQRFGLIFVVEYDYLYYINYTSHPEISTDRYHRIFTALKHGIDIPSGWEISSGGDFRDSWKKKVGGIAKLNVYPTTTPKGGEVEILLLEISPPFLSGSIFVNVDPDDFWKWDAAEFVKNAPIDDRLWAYKVYADKVAPRMKKVVGQIVNKYKVIK